MDLQFATLFTYRPESRGTMSTDTIEVADELVDEASITDGKAIVRFSKTEAALSDLRTRFKDAKFDLATTKGDTAARQARKELVSLRTGLDKRRKELKAPAVEFSRKIDSEAQRLTAAIVELEEPIDQQIKADEQRREDERVARLRAEEERVSGHRERIEAISAVAVRAVGLSSAEIAEKIALITRMEPGEDFEEFLPHAINAKASTLLRLQELHAAAVQREESEAEALRTRERLAQLERENAERQAREAQERRQREEAEAAARKLEQERLAAEQRAQQKREAQGRAARELIDEINRIQRRAFSSSAAGFLELVTLIQNLNIGPELGDFAAGVQTARDDAMRELQDMHQVVLARELEAKRLRDEQVAAQKRLDEQAAEVRRQQEEVAARERALAPPLEPPSIVETVPVTITSSHDSSVEVHAEKRPNGDLDVTISASPVDPGNPADQQDTDGEGDTPDVRHDIGTGLLPGNAEEAAAAALLNAVVHVMKAATSTNVRGRKPGPWIVPLAEMLALKAALRAVPLPGGQFYAEDGTLMTADGKRSIFDDVDE